MVRDELKAEGGFVHIDADRLRERIPVPPGAQRPSSEQTQSDAGRLVQELRRLATEGRRSIVEEGTFRDAESVGRFVEGRRQAGYGVELVAVATPREESLLGIYQRFELQHLAKTGNPRFVSEAYHDEAMAGFAKTLERLQPQLDRARVVNRAGEVLFDSQGKENAFRNASAALEAGQTPDAARLAAIASDWREIEAAAQTRGAEPDHIQAIQAHGARVQREALTTALRDLPEAEGLKLHPALREGYAAVATVRMLAQRDGLAREHVEAVATRAIGRVVDDLAKREAGQRVAGEPEVRAEQLASRSTDRGPGR
jgi:hypothetical protein